MKYPDTVKEYINFLSEYKENPELTEGDIIHMYPKKLAYPNGYYDSRYFDLVLYHQKLMQFRKLENRDGITMNHSNPPTVNIMRIFCDGSTLIRFREIVTIDVFQDVTVSAQ